MKFNNLQDTRETLIQHIEQINDKDFLCALATMTGTKLEQEEPLTEAEKQKLQQQQQKYSTCQPITPDEIANDQDDWFRGR